MNLLGTNTKLNDQIICYGLAAAGGNGAAGTGAAGSAAPPAAGDGFDAVYRDVIVANGCTSGQCHSGVAAGKLDLRSQDVAYQNLVGVAAMGTSAGPGNSCAGRGLTRVVPGDADHSLLVTKLEHTQPCGAPMPAPSVQLPAAQIQRVRAWITAGAMP